MYRITPEELIAFHRCRRLPYLQRFGPHEEQLDTDDLVKHLRLERQLLRKQIQNSHPGTHYSQPAEVSLTEEESVSHTRILMGQHHARIYGARLLGSLPDLNADVEILIQPDLLIWKAYPPRPNLPPGFYQPVEIRSSKRIKPEYELTLALHALVLGQFQPVTPSFGMVILRDGTWHRVTLNKRYPQIYRLIQSFIEVISEARIPQVYMARSRCGLCSWRQFCRQMAADSDPLTLLPGVTSNRHVLLQSIGIHTVPDLAQTPLETLRTVPGLGSKVALSLIQQARATVENRPFWSPTQLRRPHIPSAPIEIYFDIEAEPKQDVAYLLGVLVIDHTAATEHYQPLLAADPRMEETTWNEFLDLVHAHPQAPIYHFHGFEIHTCRKLAERYRTQSQVLRLLLARFVDMHEWITHHLVLPVESYSLKNIARWMGFEWQIAEANGAQSIYWYSQWLETQDRSFLDCLISYNRDDCRATFHLKRWLETHRSEIGDLLP